MQLCSRFPRHFERTASPQWLSATAECLQSLFVPAGNHAGGVLVESRTKCPDEPACGAKSAMWHKECRANNITQKFESLTSSFSSRMSADRPECIFFFCPDAMFLCLLCPQAVPPRPTTASFDRSAFFPGPCRCHGSRCHAVIQTCRNSADFAAFAAAKEAGGTDADVFNPCPWTRWVPASMHSRWPTADKVHAGRKKCASAVLSRLCLRFGF